MLETRGTRRPVVDRSGGFAEHVRRTRDIKPSTPPSIDHTLGTPEEEDEATITPDIIEDLPDKEDRYTNAEILGKSYAVQRLILVSANRSIRVTESTFARVRNLLGAPNELRYKFSQFIAEKRYNRHKRRFDAISDLPDNNRLRIRREAKLNTATERLDRIRTTLESRAARIRGRKNEIEEGFEARRENYIGELTRRKEEAIARRELRRELKNQGAGPIENIGVAGLGPIKGEILKTTPLEELRRFGRLARSLELSEESLKGAESAEQRTVNRKNELERTLKHNNQTIAELQIKAEAAKSELKTLRDPTNEDGLEQKEKKLVELKSDLASTLPDDTSNRERLIEEVNELAGEIEAIRETILSLEPAIHSAEARIKELDLARPEIESEIRRLETKRVQLSEEVSERKSIRDFDTEARNQAVNEVINN